MEEVAQLSTGSSLNIEVAGICVRVEASASSFLDLIKLRYGNFISDKKPALKLRVNHDNAVTGRALSHSQTEVFKPEYITTQDDKYLCFEGEEFKTIFDKAGDLAEVIQPPILYPFDLSLRALLSLELLQGGGFFVHASAVVKERKAYLFFGPSGSGKTTVADLAGEKTLSDDLIAVRKVGGFYWAFGTPFWEGVNKGAFLRALFSLEKADQTSLSLMKSAEALQKLMGSIECLIDVDYYRKPLFETVANLVEQVPCHQLAFSLDRPIWPVLEEAGLLKGEIAQ